MNKSSFFADASKSHNDAVYIPAAGNAATWLEDATGIVKPTGDDPGVVGAHIKLLNTNRAPEQDWDAVDQLNWRLCPLTYTKSVKGSSVTPWTSTRSVPATFMSSGRRFKTPSRKRSFSPL